MGNCKWTFICFPFFIIISHLLRKLITREQKHSRAWHSKCHLPWKLIIIGLYSRVSLVDHCRAQLTFERKQLGRIKVHGACYWSQVILTGRNMDVWSLLHTIFRSWFQPQKTKASIAWIVNTLLFFFFSHNKQGHTFFFYVLLTVHVSIILVINQPDAQNLIL